MSDVIQANTPGSTLSVDPRLNALAGFFSLFHAPGERFFLFTVPSDQDQVKGKKRDPRTAAFDDPSAAAVAALGMVSSRVVYFSISVFAPGATERLAANVMGARALWVDLDVDPATYPTLPEALAALKEFGKRLLPRSLVVASGGGLQVYWITQEFMPVEVWRALSSRFRTAAERLGLKIKDPGCTTDAARVFRVPFSSNFKTGKARPVEIQHSGVDYSIAALQQALQKFPAHASKSPVTSPSKPFTGDQNALLDELLDELRAIGALGIVDNEPEWFAAVQAIKRELSGHSDGFILEAADAMSSTAAKYEGRDVVASKLDRPPRDEGATLDGLRRRARRVASSIVTSARIDRWGPPSTVFATTATPERIARFVIPAEAMHPDYKPWVNANYQPKHIEASIAYLTRWHPNSPFNAPVAEPRAWQATPVEMGSAANSKRGQPAQASRLLDHLDGIALYKAPGTFDCYADLTRGGIRRTYEIRSNAFREYLTLQSSLVNNGKAMSRSAVDTVIDTYAAKAATTRPREVSLRFAAHGADAWIDVGDETWRAIHVAPQGWDIVQSVDVPVRFRRPASMLPLPLPNRVADPAATLKRLGQVIHLNDADLVMLATMLCMAMAGRGPLAPFSFSGDPGAAKTSAMRYGRRLIDPANTLHIGMPRTVEDLMVVARNNAVVCIDNVSGLSAEMSDALCGLATGRGTGKRKNYTDNEVSEFFLRRPVLMTGIGNFVTRGDLNDRRIDIAVGAISRAHRLMEVEADWAFETLHQDMLGALLEGIVRGLAGLPRPVELPRMADFFNWCRGAATAYTTAANYDAVFDRAGNAQKQQQVEDDPVLRAVGVLFELAGSAGQVITGGTGGSGTGPLFGSGLGGIRGTLIFDSRGQVERWHGEMHQLLSTLSNVQSGLTAQLPMGWPQLPRALTARLSHGASALQGALGITIIKQNQAHGRTHRTLVELHR